MFSRQAELTYMRQQIGAGTAAPQISDLNMVDVNVMRWWIKLKNFGLSDDDGAHCATLLAPMDAAARAPS